MTNGHWALQQEVNVRDENTRLWLPFMTTLNNRSEQVIKSDVADNMKKEEEEDRK